MSKQISTEWKSFDETVLEKRTNQTIYLWQKFLEIPSQMKVEFSLSGKVIKHSYYVPIHYNDKGHAWEIENGKKIFKSFDVEPHFRIWNGDDWENFTPEFVYENVQVRPNAKEAKVYNKYIDDLKIGDFVKFTGQRNPNIWKKIVNIHENTLTCIQYYKPIDDNSYMQANATDTLIWKIKEKHNG